MIPRTMWVFGLVGVVATITHYGVMVALSQLSGLLPPSQATMVGSVFGILVSFFGNRLFTFRAQATPLLRSFVTFIGLYAAIAALHGGAMALGAERWGWNVTLVFVLATGFATMLSYFGSKHLVFRL